MLAGKVAMRLDEQVVQDADGLYRMSWRFTILVARTSSLGVGGAVVIP